MKKENKGFDPQQVADYRKKIEASPYNFVFDEEDENNEEYAHFYFVGKYKGKDVVYDAVIYTLRLQHESELYEIAEERAEQHFPDFRKLNEDQEGDENDPRMEEIGLYMAEVIMELEEDQAVKVQEHVNVDEDAEFGISLDVGLNVPVVSPEVIQKFVNDYTNNTLSLDPTLYSFETEDQEDED
jgi:hypothetical protein